MAGASPWLADELAGCPKIISVARTDAVRSRNHSLRSMRRLLAVVGVPILFIVLAVGRPAAADAPGESNESAHLVREALALIVNTPRDVAGIEEKIDDALKAGFVNLFWL